MEPACLRAGAPCRRGTACRALQPCIVYCRAACPTSRGGYPHWHSRSGSTLKVLLHLGDGGTRQDAAATWSGDQQQCPFGAFIPRHAPATAIPPSIGAISPRRRSTNPSKHFERRLELAPFGSQIPAPGPPHSITFALPTTGSVTSVFFAAHFLPSCTAHTAGPIESMFNF